MRPESPSKCDANLELDRPRRHKVRAAERGQEVVESLSVCEIDDGQAHTYLRSLAVQEVVHAQPQIQEMPRRDARRVADIIRGAIRGNDQARGAAVGGGAV